MRSIGFMRWFLFASVGCASTVRVDVPATPVVPVEARAMAVVTDHHACDPIADRLADQLRTADIDVRPDASARITVFACNLGWSSTEARSHALAALTQDGALLAQLLGAAARPLPSRLSSTESVRHRKRLERDLHHRVAQDLAEQVLPVPLRVTRKIYTNTPVGSARSFHNLAVAAEREGKLEDALWWAERAQEVRPSKLRARYVEELSRRLNRVGSTPL